MPQTISTRPRIVLSGTGATTIRSIRVSREERTVSELRVRGGKPEWPDSLELAAGETYRLEFIPIEGAAGHATFVARAAASPRPTDNLLIITVP